MPEATIEVIGVPRPKGNLGRNAYGKSYNRGKGLKEWIEVVEMDAARQWRRGKICKPDAVWLGASFRLQQPRRNNDLDAVVKPDLSKLMRGVEDAMTGVVYEDDSQIVGYIEPCEKRWCNEGEPPGATITVRW